MGDGPGLDLRAAHVVDKYQQAIDSFAVICDGQDNVLDAFETLVRSDIGRFGQERLTCFDNMGTVLPDRAWRFLITNLRKPRARVVFEKMFRNIGADQAIPEIQLWLAFDIEDHGMWHKLGNIDRIDIRSTWKAIANHFSAPV